ncbi:apolipoprotein L4-like [Eleutherodactylus coqui]|uniref:apolipoprotein L4-like n=1 Tax=Eleutherodactylus coqui TaxID=57060 RepID=UPI0034638377
MSLTPLSYIMLQPKQQRERQQIKEYLRGFKGLVGNLIEKIESCIIEMTTIAEDLDKFHRGATIASVTGSSFGIAGGITTIVGLALAPVTLGASLIVSGVGIGVAVAGGVTGASASIADTVNMKKKSNKVQELVNQINEMMKGLKEISDNISSEVENIQVRFNQDELFDSTRVLGRSVLSAVEASRMTQLGKISTVASRGAQLATRGVQAAAVISGVLAAVFIIIDAIFIVKGAIDLHKGSKTEEAASIRACAEELKIISLDLQEEHDKCSKELSFIFKY